jgi:hypothetical protein
VPEGWFDLVPIRLVTFAEVGLPITSSDRAVWRYAQDHNLLLLTANLAVKYSDSLEQTLREENTLASLPILTIRNLDRVQDGIYREACATR